MKLTGLTVCTSGTRRTDTVVLIVHIVHAISAIVAWMRCTDINTVLGELCFCHNDRKDTVHSGGQVVITGFENCR